VNAATRETQSGISALVRQILAFLVLVSLLQGLWSAARGTAVERLVIHGATVSSAVALINLVTPDVRAVAVGSRISASGGGLNILNGCEGVEVLFLLLAALIAFPLPPRRRVLGVAIGTLFVFVLNQARILALFYAFRADRTLFGQLHGTVAPIVLIVATALFFLFWTRNAGAGRAPHDAAASA
jgi:exosortase family protein XrtM